jgi:hypothetical protein
MLDVSRGHFVVAIGLAAAPGRNSRFVVSPAFAPLALAEEVAK